MTDEMESLPLADMDATPIEERKLGLKDRVRMIRFGDEFKKWPVNRKIDYLKKLASAMNQCASDMQDERNAALDALALAEKQTENADKAVAIQKDIVITQLTSSNAQQQELAKIIQGLERKNKELQSTIDQLSVISEE